MARLQIDGLAKHFGSTVAVHDVSLDIHDGEFVVLLQPWLREDQTLVV